MQLCDEGGQLLARLSGVRLRRVALGAAQRAPLRASEQAGAQGTGPATEQANEQATEEAAARWSYELRWQPAPVVRKADEASPRVAVLLDRGGAGARLVRQLAAERVEVRACAALDELATLVGFAPTHLIACSLLDGGSALEVSERALQVVQAHAAQGWSSPPRLWLVTRGAQLVDEDELVDVAQAAAWGLGRCAALELAERWGGLVDLDAYRDEAATLAQLVHQRDEAQLAVREGRWLAARLVRSARPAARPAPLRGGATYVISGGLGAIGWQIVEAWIARGADSLVLLGRRPPSAAQAAQLAGWAARGVTVRALGVDVADGAALGAAWAELAALPPVRGVIHAAGQLADAAVLRLGGAALAAVLAPKLDGARQLARLLAGQPLEHFVLFSSLAGVLGSPGQAAYAAANAALDGLVHELRGQGVPARSLAWGPWQIGLAAGHQQELAARGAVALPSPRALELLVENLTGEPAQLVITAAELAAVAAQLPPGARSVLAGFTGAAAAPASAADAAAPAPLLAQLRPLSAARRRAQISEGVTRELRQLLGRAPGTHLDPEQSLFELGLDSLSAVQLRASLQRSFGCALPASLAFEYPTLQALAEAVRAGVEELLGQAPTPEPVADPTPEPVADPAAPSSAGREARARDARPLSARSPLELSAAAEELRRATADQAALAAEPIAIVGMGCRFAGGVRSPDELWQLLAGGVDAITEIPASRWDRELWYDADPDAPGKTRIRHGGFLDDIDQFDARFFRLSPREARCMDPQHRLLLEVCWEALEDAGQDAHRLHGSRTGVFMGFMNNDYASHAELAELQGHLATGNGISNAVGRISFAFGLHGPSVALDTACSSSLVAIHQAVESLRARESDLALAGGVSLILSPGLTVLMSKLGGLALDGHCKTFDAAADGYVRSEGCGVLVLKRLGEAVRDRDRVVAVIRGSATNHGGRGGGFSQPNARAQQMLIREALARSQTEPRQVSYLEAHGTGTPLGDPIEYRAAAAVFAAGRSGETPLAIGSIKTNFGHAEAAAGVAGVMKVALGLREAKIPPHLNLRQLSAEIDLSLVPARIPTELTAWPAIDGRRIAGVSGFGMSGVNAHVVLEEAGALASPAAQEEGEGENGRRAELVALSAQSEEALAELVRRTAARLDEQAARGERLALREVAGTAGARRAHHGVRLAVVAHDRAELTAALRKVAAGQRGAAIHGASEAGARPRVVFVCPGQGSQWQGMGRELYAGEPAFAAAFERCAAAARPYLGGSLVERLHDEAPLAGIDVIQPLLFAMSVALGELWRAWGVEPDAVIGHSMGEVAAAYLAGALSLDDAARVICRRSQLMLEVAGRGAMAVVELGEAALAPRLARSGGALCIAAANSTRSSVVTGEAAAVAQLLGELAEAKIFARAIKVDVASHGPQVDPLAEPLVAALRELAPRAPAVAMWSSVEAAPVEGEELGAAYWMRNLRQPVRFAETIQALLASEHALFVELSPHPILATAIEHTALDGGRPAWVVGSLERGKPERAAMLRGLGELYARGLALDFRRLYPKPAAVALPTYPFQRQRYWVEQVETTPLLLRHRPGTGGAGGAAAVDSSENRTSPALARWAYRLSWQEVAAPAAAGGRRVLLLVEREASDPEIEAEADQLGAALAHAGHEVAVLAGAAAWSGARVAELARVAGRPFHAAALLGRGSDEAQLARALAALEAVGAPPLWVVTRGGQSVGGEVPDRLAAARWGLARAQAAELPAGRCVVVDLGGQGELESLARWLAAPAGEAQLALRDGRAWVPRLIEAERALARELEVSGNRTYWLGGDAGFAAAAARELAGRGARHLHLELAGGPDEALGRELAGRGVAVRWGSADALELATAQPPIAALLYALAPASPGERRPVALELAQLAALDAAFGELPLEQAWLFAPAAALLGGSGQAGPAAGAEAAAALAASWRQRGVAAEALLLASWPGRADAALEGLGIAPLAMSDVLDVALAAAGRARPAALPAGGLLLAQLDWALFRAAYAQRGDERFLGELGTSAAAPDARARWTSLAPEAARAALFELVCDEAREVLGAAPEQALPPRATFTELGLDSVMALKLMTRLGRALELRLATVLVFEHPTPAALAAHLASEVLQLGGGGEAASGPGAPATADALAGPAGPAPGGAALDDDDLSEDELAALLLRKLAPSS